MVTITSVDESSILTRSRPSVIPSGKRARIRAMLSGSIAMTLSPSSFSSISSLASVKVLSTLATNTSVLPCSTGDGPIIAQSILASSGRIGT